MRGLCVQSNRVERREKWICCLILEKIVSRGNFIFRHLCCFPRSRQLWRAKRIFFFFFGARCYTGSGYLFSLCSSPQVSYVGRLKWTISRYACTSRAPSMVTRNVRFTVEQNKNVEELARRSDVFVLTITMKTAMSRIGTESSSSLLLATRSSTNKHAVELIGYAIHHETVETLNTFNCDDTSFSCK